MSTNYFSFFCLFLLFSCGKDSGNSDEFTRQEEEAPEPEVLQSIYRADLKPLNAQVVKKAEGQVVVRIERDTFEVALAVQNVPSSLHPQYILDAKNCPNQGSDINGDGYVDLAEAQAATGPIWLPLDGDLDNASEDSRNYPNGGVVRAFVYREDTSRSRLLADLGDGANF